MVWTIEFGPGGNDPEAGEGGLGKSQLLLAMAAAIPRAPCCPTTAALPPSAGPLSCSAEDSPETTIKPRLMAMGADLSRITLLKASVTIKRPGKEPLVHPVSLQDLGLWRSVFSRRADTVLFIVDPLPSYLGRGVNDLPRITRSARSLNRSWRDHQAGLICMSANTHLNKSIDQRLRPIASLARLPMEPCSERAFGCA